MGYLGVIFSLWIIASKLCLGLIIDASNIFKLSIAPESDSVTG